MRTALQPRLLRPRFSWLPRTVLPLFGVLLVAALALLWALRVQPNWMLDIGVPPDSRFIQGMLKSEVAPVTNYTFRWTEPVSQIWLPGTEFGNFTLQLRLHQDPQVKVDQDVTVTRGSDSLGTFRLQHGWRVYHMLLPGSLSQAQSPLTLSTAAIHVASDSEDRGMPFDWVQLRPLSAAPPWRALWLTWGLVVVAGWLWQFDRLLLPRKNQQRGVRVAVLVGVLALALVAWTWLNPLSMLALLPPTPWAMGFASVLLLGVLLTSWRQQQQSRGVVLLSIGLLVLGQVLMVTQIAVVPGVICALLALMILPLGRISVPGLSERLAQAALPSQRIHYVLLGVLLLVALGLRYYRLADLPYGLWRDEARHALEGLQILNDPSYRPIYILQRVDLPGLGMYPFALALWIWGIHTWTLRMVTALAGALTILPLYGVVRQLFGPRVALLAAAMLACSHWHIAISRFSFPTIFDPLLQLTALWLLLVGLRLRSHSERRKRLLAFGSLLLSGVSLGLALQTYHTGRLGIATLGLLAILLLFQSRKQWRSWLLGMAVLAVGFLLTVAPLLSYVLHNAEGFNQRVGSVFILSSDSSNKQAALSKLDDSLGRHLLMFNVRGDSNGRHVAPDTAMLDLISGLGLLAGLSLLLHHWRAWRSLFLLGALLIGLAPSMLAVDYPHAMRSIDALPYACVIAALGLMALWQLLGQTLGVALQLPRVAGYAAGVALAVMIGLNSWLYFVLMPSNPLVWTASYPYYTQIGRYLRDQADAHGGSLPETVYVPERVMNNDVFRYLTYGLAIKTLPSETTAWKLPAKAFVIVPNAFDPSDLDAFLGQNSLDPDSRGDGPMLPDGVRPSFLIFYGRP